jgi:AraC-like DNA-binding protein
MIEYREHKILKPLGIANRAWIIDNNNHTHCDNIRCLPNGATNICFILGNGVAIRNGIQNDKLTEGVYLIGQTTRKVVLNIKPFTKLILLEFAPWTTCQFLHCNYSITKNQIIDLQEISASINFQLLALLDYNEKIIIYKSQQILSTSLCQNNSSKLIRYAYSLLNENFLTINTNMLASRLGYSSRYIQKKFKENIGLTPNEYINVIKIRRAFDKIISAKMSLTKIAHDMNFHDQSHFIKNFKKVTNCCPSNIEGNDYLLPNKNIASSYFYNF